MSGSVEQAYRSPGAAEEYHERHRKSAARRWVSRRECGIVCALLEDLPPGASVLDAACGAGRLAERLHKRGWKVFALDASPEMLHLGLEKGSLSPGRAAAGSIFRLPFADKSMQGCACLRFLHHLETREGRVAAFRELARVSTDVVVLSLWTRWNVQYLRRRLKRLLGKRPGTRYAVCLGGVRRELEEAGLTVERIRFLYPFFSETVYISARPAPVE